MAISVDWENRIVHIPKADLTPTPNSDLYTLDIEDLRWWLMDVMDDADGMVNPTIFEHNTTVYMSGIKYARFIEIINGYTIAFEDIPANPYGVLLGGANHNVLDVNRFNTTSLLGNNSAGLIYNDVGNLGDVNVASVAGVPINDPSEIGPQPDVLAAEILNTDVNLFTAQDTVGQAIWRSRFLKASIYVNTNSATNGDGSQQDPFDNVNDAKDMVEATGIQNIVVAGSVVVPGNLKNMNVYGIGLPDIDLNGMDVKGSRFERVELKGNSTGSIEAEDCEILDGFYMNGHFHNCSLMGDVFVTPNSETLLATCMSGIPGLDRPTLSMNSGLPSAVSIRGWKGGLTIKNCDHIDDVITVGLTEGSLTFDNSCTNGTMVARGLGKFVDETAGATVVDEMTYEEDINAHTSADGQKTRNTVIAN